MVNKNWQKRSAITELCSQCNSKADKETGKWIELSMQSTWIHLTCCNLVAYKLDLLTSSLKKPEFCENCSGCNIKLISTADEVHCLKKDVVNCLNDKVSQPGTYTDLLDKQV